MVNQSKNYCKYFSNIKLFNKTVSLVKILKKSGYMVALTTTSHIASTKIVLDKA